MLTVSRQHNAELEHVAKAMIQELVAKGFVVEDMESVYGSEFRNEFRWINTKTNEFQDSYVSYTAAEAWLDCAISNT